MWCLEGVQRSDLGVCAEGEEGMSDSQVAFAFNHVALGASAAIAAWLVTDVIRERKKVMDEQACAGCQGTGFVDCFCTKWDFSAANSKGE